MITIKNPITTTNFIDRFLISEFGVDVILLFNKIDLFSEEDQKKTY